MGSGTSSGRADEYELRAQARISEGGNVNKAILAENEGTNNGIVLGNLVRKLEKETGLTDISLSEARDGDIHYNGTYKGAWVEYNGAGDRRYSVLNNDTDEDEYGTLAQIKRKISANPGRYYGR